MLSPLFLLRQWGLLGGLSFGSPPVPQSNLYVELNLWHNGAILELASAGYSNLIW